MLHERRGEHRVTPAGGIIMQVSPTMPASASPTTSVYCVVSSMSPHVGASPKLLKNCHTGSSLACTQLSMRPAVSTHSSPPQPAFTAVIMSW